VLVEPHGAEAEFEGLPAEVQYLPLFDAELDGPAVGSGSRGDDLGVEACALARIPPDGDLEALGGDLGEPSHLGEGVNVYEDAIIEEVDHGLVGDACPGEHDVVPGEPAAEGELGLVHGENIRVGPLVCEGPQDRRVEVSLHGVVYGDAPVRVVLQAVPEPPVVLEHPIDVVDVGGGAELVRYPGAVSAAYVESVADDIKVARYLSHLGHGTHIVRIIKQ